MALQNRKGFTLVEVMLAIAIIGMLLTPMLFLEQLILGQSWRVSSRFHRFSLAQKFLYDAREKQPIGATQFSLETRENDPPVTLVYRIESVEKTSSLSSVAGLYNERVTLSWRENDLTKNQALVTFQFYPERRG